MDGPPQKRARIEVYGFVFWTLSWVFLFAYIAWAFVPDSVWHPLGIYYYPNRYWSYTVPLYLFLLWVFSVIVYLAYNLINTEPLDSFYTISDEKANDDGETLSLKDPDQIVPIADVPLTVVNELLYQQHSRDMITTHPLASSAPSRDGSFLRGKSLLQISSGNTKKRDHVRQATT